MKKLIFFLILILMSVSADAQVYLWRYRSHATDCTALTDGKLRDLCYEEDSQDVYKCVPSAGDCSGSECKLVGNEFLKNISEDPTPQLGGELDGQGIPANSLQAIANSIQTSVNSLKSSYPTATITPNMDVNVQVDVS